MESKLGLNMELVNQARQSAAKVADDVQVFIDQHTTVTVERAVCRLLGVDGVNAGWTSRCPTWWWIICWQFPCSLQALLGRSAMPW